MGLFEGKRLGPYEIVAPLGAGGMGEVYRARDTRLDRTVAIKVLNSQLVASAELRGRFEREAKVISQLQHPNICVLHDVGNDSGVEYLVMEYLEGESLSERLKRGPLPPAELLKIATEIADALEKAHRAGIIHRDLKPGNVMLTKSGAKLLDFGLAKPTTAVTSAATGSSSQSVLHGALTANSPASPLSSAGNIIGTVQYMAPEQIGGGEADARCDVFAFGLVLFEMATGRRAFEGKTQASIVGQILAVDPPPISKLQPGLPSGFERTVRVCLEKDPDERFQTMHDVKLRLIEIAESPEVAPAPTVAPARSSGRVVWAIAAAALVLAIAAGYFAYLATRPVQVFRATLLGPEKSIIITTAPDSGVPVLSPDGTRLAFVARDPSGKSLLFVRALNSLTAQPLAGTENAIHPFWAPDSRNIGFFSEGKLRRIDANGGPAQELANTPRGRGGAWNSDGTIVFAPGINDVLMRVPAGGGTAVPVTKMAEGETSHRWPSFLPDGKHFLFWQRGPKSGIAIGTLDSLDHTPLFENSSNAVYAPPGYALFVREQTLLARPFSASKLEFTGDVIPVAEHLAVNGPSYRAVFSVSQTGALVYQIGGASQGWQLMHVARDGKPLPGIPEHATFLYPRLSPDNKLVASSIAEPSGSNVDIWIFDLTRGTKTRLTFDNGVDSYPAWTPDGKTIYYSNNRNGHANIYSKAANGSGSEQVVLEDDSEKSWKCVTPDGRSLVFQRYDTGKPNSAIWMLPLVGERKAVLIVRTEGNTVQPAVSPDGRWLAYQSDESHRPEIYITPFPGGGAKWQVSTTGGFAPRWRADGKELFFEAFDGSVSAVDVTLLATTVTLGTPHQVVQASLAPSGFGPFDVYRDGKQFMLNGTATQDGDTPLTLVSNWLTDLKK